MSKLRSVFNSLGGLAVGGIAGWTIVTRNSKFVPILATDPIWTDPHIIKYNPHQNDCTNDFCVRRVPLKNIKPQLLEKEGKLVEAFCGSVWGGLGKRLSGRRWIKVSWTDSP